MPFGTKGGSKTPYIRSPKVDAKNSGSVNTTPEGGSQPHGHDNLPGGRHGVGNTRRGPH